MHRPHIDRKIHRDTTTASQIHTHTDTRIGTDIQIKKIQLDNETHILTPADKQNLKQTLP